MSLGQLKRKMRVNGTVPEKSVELLAMERTCPNSVSAVYRRGDGGTEERPRIRWDEANLSTPKEARLWPFHGDGRLLSLISEAYRIHLGLINRSLLTAQASG